MVKDAKTITRVPKKAPSSGEEMPVQKKLNEAESRKLKIKREAEMKRKAKKAENERRAMELAERQERERGEMLSRPPPPPEIMQKFSVPFSSMPDISFVDAEMLSRPSPPEIKKKLSVPFPSMPDICFVDRKRDVVKANVFIPKEIRASKRSFPTSEASPAKRAKAEAYEGEKATARREDEMTVEEAPVNIPMRKIELILERELALDRNDQDECKKIEKELANLEEFRCIQVELRKRPLPTRIGIKPSPSFKTERNRRLAEGKRIKEALKMEKMWTSGGQISKYDPFNRRSTRPIKIGIKPIITEMVTTVETAEIAAPDPVGPAAEIINEEATIPLILQAVGLMRVPVPVDLAEEIIEEEATIPITIDDVPLHDFIPENSDRVSRCASSW